MDSDAHREKLKKILSEVDKNGDGHIDRAEFGELLAKLGAPLSSEEADAAFSDVDRDGNGSVDFDELAFWWKFPFLGDD